MAEQIKEKEATTVKVIATEKRQEQVGSMPGLEKEITPTQPRLQTRSVGLLARDETENFRARWTVIQTGFVDEPRQAVEQADALVAEVTKRLSELFTREQAQLKGQWDHPDNLSTEDLRVTLQRYRSYFGRLLSI